MPHYPTYEIGWEIVGGLDIVKLTNSPSLGHFLGANSSPTITAEGISRGLDCQVNSILSLVASSYAYIDF